MEHFQKVIYLLSLFLPVMVFFSLGLWFAWARWFKHCQQFDEAMEEHHELVEKLNFLYMEQTSISEKWESSPAKQVVTEKKVSDSEAAINDSESELQFLKDQLREMELDQDKDADELISLREENASLKQKLTLVVDTNHDDTFSGIEIVEAILNDFADEPVSNDPELGILFQEEPDVVDNLTLIDVLSPKIAAKLNELGVYRYRQISLWSHDQFDQILAKIGIDPNHVIGKNGAWQLQAYELHSEHH